jgi:hypothetical protein
MQAGIKANFTFAHNGESRKTQKLPALRKYLQTAGIL